MKWVRRGERVVVPGQFARVQTQACRHFFHVVWRVQIIAKNWLVKRQQMHAQLMAAACHRLQAKSRAATSFA